jgi:hypothetical protein
MRKEIPASLRFREQVMKIRVICYHGHKANERPLKFFIGDKVLEVRELLDRWYGENDDYFKVLADDGNTYVLKYSRDEDRWELALYTSPKLHQGLKSGIVPVQTSAGKKH